MIVPPIPDDEEARLRELHSYDVLDTAAERAYDALVRIAAEVTGRPIALISLVDRDRQWFKARVGLNAEQTSRDASFCAHMVTGGEPLIVRDALRDERFHDNPLVIDDPSIRFYAGAPIISPREHVLGSLCVIDTEPGDISDAQISILEMLAEQAVQLLEMRRIGAQWKRDRREARAFFEASLDFLCLASFDGHFLDLNDVWVDVLGYDAETLKSRPFTEFIDPDDRERVVTEIGALRGGGELREFSVRFVTSSGERRLLQFNATSDTGAQRYIAVARDITEAHERTQALAAARDAAEQANQSKSVFLANMSHELRTPLNSVIGFANVLLKNKDGNLAPKQLDYLHRIKKNGRHLLSLLNDILDVSKIEVGQLDFVREPLDLRAVVQELVATIGPDSARLDLDLPDLPLQPVVGDSRRLQQVLTNIVGNALKFSPTDRRVTIRVTAAGDRVVSLSVIDQGIGIAEAALERIFEPFEQAESGTERRFGGTGLGLTISRSLCDSMGFSLSATSKLGDGSTFTIAFDRQAPPIQPAKPRRNRAVTPAPTRQAPVLILDDEPESRLLLESVVADLGYPVVACDAPRLAVQLAETLRPRAILLDLMMPDIDGFHVLRSFEQHPGLSEVPIVVVSIVGPENRNRLHHAIDVLPKPIERQELARVLRGIPEATRRVLVVDDDDDARQLVVAALSGRDVEVVESRNGSDALQQLEEHSFDAVVLDTMPVMDGVALLRHIRKEPRFKELPVVVFSAVSGAHSQLSEQVSAIVRKDGDADTLRDALERVL